MSRIYNSQNKIKFTSISERYQVNKAYKGRLSQLHSDLITYVSSHFKNTNKYKQQVVDILNLMTYTVYSGDFASALNWKKSNPFANVPDIDEDLIEDTIGDLFLTVDSIDWDVKPKGDVVDGITYAKNQLSESKSEVLSNTQVVTKTNVSSAVKQSQTKRKIQSSQHTPVTKFSATPKQDLYIQSPIVPRFDYNKRWMEGHEGTDDLVIYTTLPEIPTRQNEISCTTDVTKMTYAELMNLYPNVVIQTRAPMMYQHTPGLDYDDDLGVILPIDGYSHEELVDNIIRFPHFFQLTRQYEDQLYSFYSHIEIDGELVKITDVWDELPDTKKIPRQKEFVKEYVVRKYLLDLTIKKVKYKYPLFGNLDPFLTLFMPHYKYTERGYDNVEDIARKCVVSRVKYKQSRNPIMRRIQKVYATVQ